MPPAAGGRRVILRAKLGIIYIAARFISRNKVTQTGIKPGLCDFVILISVRDEALSNARATTPV